MKPFTKAGIAVFGIIALIHLARLATGWEVIINGTVVAGWISAVALVLFSLLAFGVWKESK